jgi:hypothetical protein
LHHLSHSNFNHTSIQSEALQLSPPEPSPKRLAFLLTLQPLHRWQGLWHLQLRHLQMVQREHLPLAHQPLVHPPQHRLPAHQQPEHRLPAHLRLERRLLEHLPLLAPGGLNPKQKSQSWVVSELRFSFPSLWGSPLSVSLWKRTWNNLAIVV